MLIRLVAVIALAIFLAACQGQVNAKLDNSIGLATYENLGFIERLSRAPAS